MSVIALLKKLRDFVVRHFHELMQIHDTPHSIAGGVAIGIFFGFVPLFIPLVPIKTSLSILFSWIFRCSKVAALISVTAHDILFPVWPLVLRWEYVIGYWLLHHEMPPKILRVGKHHVGIEHWFRIETYHGWTQWIHERLNWAWFVHILGPMLLGSLIIGIPCGLICYGISLVLVKRYRAARLAKETGEAESNQ